MEPLIVPLRGCSALPQSVVGGKAHMLGCLLDAGMLVPDGFCLTTRLFYDACRRTELGALIERATATLQANPVQTGRCLEQIRIAIQSLELPADIHALVHEACTSLLQRGPVAVRSSAPDEDGHAESFAGAFTSSLHVADSAGVFAALYDAWASLFSEMVFSYNRRAIDMSLAVVVQLMVEPEQSGVLFSRDPLRGCEGPIVEFNNGHNVSITAGLGAAQRVSLAPGDTATAGLAPQLDAALRAVISPAEALVGGGVDLEWAWADGRFYVLQARCITVAGRGHTYHTRWENQEDVSAVDTLNLGHCQALFARQLQKKVWFRRLCAAQHLDTFRLFYLCYHVTVQASDIAPLVAQLRMPLVRLHWGSGSVLTTPSRTVEALRAHAHLNALDEGGWSCVQVGEVIPAEQSGFASCMADGRVLIEAFPDGLIATSSGDLAPSSYVLDAHDWLCLRAPAEFRQRAVLDDAVGDWVTIDTPAFHLDLQDEQLRALAALTRVLQAHLGEVRLEWYIYRDTVYVFDMTIEQGPLALNAGRGTILASGYAEGEVVRLDDLAAYDQLAAEYGISVVNHGAQQEAARVSELVRQISQRTASSGGWIIVADYPSTGLIPLIPYARGFVFARGALLSHMAIVLRERGVPAMIWSEAGEHLPNGARIGIGPDGTVRRLNAPQTERIGALTGDRR